LHITNNFRRGAYIIEVGHFGKAHVLRSTNKWFLCHREDAALEIRVATVTVDEDVAFTKVGFAAAEEVLVVIAKLVEIGGGLGSLRIR
jgi:hypothetical protein